MENEDSLMKFVKALKPRNLNKLPPTYFTMINSLAICLLVVCQKDKNKIKSFVNFWMEKIELEDEDETQYDYPKYVLRNTICNLMFDLHQYLDCIKLCNFTIKEITSEVKFISRTGVDKDGINIKEKVKLMVLAHLYKIDCYLCIKLSNRDACIDVLVKCSSLVDKYALRDDDALAESIDNKYKLIQSGDFTDTKDDNCEISSSAGKLVDKEHHKNFVIKSKHTLDLSETPRSNINSYLEAMIHSRKNKKEITESSPKYNILRNSIKNVHTDNAINDEKFNSSKFNVSLEQKSVTQSSRHKRVQSTKSKIAKDIERQRVSQSKGHNKSGHQSVRYLQKEFNKEIEELFQIGTALRKEIVSIKTTRNHGNNSVRIIKSDRFYEESNLEGSDRHSDSDLNLEVRKKVQTIFDNQVELEKQGRIFNEKLERINKNMRNNTSNELFDQKTIDDILPEVKKTTSMKKPTMGKEITKDSRRTSFSIAATDKLPVGGSLRVIPEFPSNESKRSLIRVSSAVSTVSQKSKTHQLMIKSYDQVLEVCLNQFDRPVTGSTLIDLKLIKQKIYFEECIYDLLYDLRNGSGKDLNNFSIIIKLFKEDANFTGTPILSQTLDGNTLDFILKKLHGLEVIPSKIPITSLIHIGYIVNFIMHKFIHVMHHNADRETREQRA